MRWQGATHPACRAHDVQLSPGKAFVMGPYTPPGAKTPAKLGAQLGRDKSQSSSVLMLNVVSDRGRGAWIWEPPAQPPCSPLAACCDLWEMWHAGRYLSAVVAQRAAFHHWNGATYACIHDLVVVVGP